MDFERRHAAIAHAVAAAGAAKTSRSAKSTFRRAVGQVVGLQRRHGPSAAPSMLLRTLSAMVFECESKFSRLVEAPAARAAASDSPGGDQDPIFSSSASRVALVFELLSSFSDTHLHTQVVSKLNKYSQGSLSRRNIFNFLKVRIYLFAFCRGGGWWWWRRSKWGSG